MIASAKEVIGTAAKYSAVKGKTYRMIEGKDGLIPRDPDYPLGSPGLIAKSAVKDGQKPPKQPTDPKGVANEASSS